MNILFVLGGLLGLVLGGEYLVRGAVALAQRVGLSPLVIGLTVVGFGTSAPELVTSVQAALLGAPDIALGNVVGSNIYNILGILGVTALARPIPIPPQIAQLDVWVMSAATLALIIAVMAWQQIGRVTGILFLGAYAAYTGWLVAAA